MAFFFKQIDTTQKDMFTGAVYNIDSFDRIYINGKNVLGAVRGDSQSPFNIATCQHEVAAQYIIHCILKKKQVNEMLLHLADTQGRHWDDSRNDPNFYK